MQPTIVKTSKSELCLWVAPDEAEYISVEDDVLCYQIKHELNYSSHAVPLPFPCELIGPLKDMTEEKPTPEKYGFHNSKSFDDTSGWMFEGGEDKYYEALELWEYRQAALSTGLKGNFIILKRTE